jgi:uncharacterized protein (DUF433 family)
LWLKGRRIRAAVVYEAVHGPDPRSPEEFARDYRVPLPAVLEALDYVAQNLPLIQQERDREAARLRARGLIGPAHGGNELPRGQAALSRSFSGGMY